MPNNRTPSLLLRLSLSVGTITMLLFLGAVLFLYGSMSHSIRSGIDRELTNTADVVLHRLDEDKDPIDKELLDLPEHLRIRILDRTGHSLLQSSGLEAPPPLVCSSERSARTFQEWSNAKGEAAKLLTFPWSGGWIQLIRVHQEEDALLARFRLHLGLVLAVVPLVGVVFGFLVIRQGLLPINRLAERTRAISPQTLMTAFNPEKVPRELLPLVHGLNQAQDRLHQAFSRMNELNGDMAHELRTPLHSVRLELESIAARSDLPAKVSDALAGVVENLDYFSALIQQLLFLAQAEDPSHVITREVVDTRDLLEKAIAPYESLAEEKGIRFEIVVGKTHLSADPTLLRRAVHNLLGNAIRHSYAGSSIRLAATFSNGFGMIEVEDKGTGIPADVIPHLGQRFFRPDASRAQATGGTGLGLAIVRGIAHLHGGEFNIESREGYGTLSRITFQET